MSLLKKKDRLVDAVWRQCVECGNRYQTERDGSGVSCCSIKCENAALRRQRDQVETTWIRATWFLR